MKELEWTYAVLTQTSQSFSFWIICHNFSGDIIHYPDNLFPAWTMDSFTYIKTTMNGSLYCHFQICNLSLYRCTSLNQSIASLIWCCILEFKSHTLSIALKTTVLFSSGTFIQSHVMVMRQHKICWIPSTHICFSPLFLHSNSIILSAVCIPK